MAGFSRALSELVALAAPRTDHEVGCGEGFWMLRWVKELWRIPNVVRGRYLPQWGNTPGHVQNWSKGGFLELAERFIELDHIRTPLPWTMVLGRPRR